MPHPSTISAREWNGPISHRWGARKDPSGGGSHQYVVFQKNDYQPNDGDAKRNLHIKIFAVRPIAGAVDNPQIHLKRDRLGRLRETHYVYASITAEDHIGLRYIHDDSIVIAHEALDQELLDDMTGVHRREKYSPFFLKYWLQAFDEATATKRAVTLNGRMIA